MGKKYLEGTRIEDLTGKNFSHWKVLNFDWERYNKDKIENTKSVHTCWICQCDCEDTTIKSVDGYSLKNNLSKSCGCLQEPSKLIKDLTGKKVGLLTVLGMKEKEKSDKNVLWICKCECGNERYITSSLLNSEKVYSCGCIKRKIPRRSNDLIGMKFNRLTVLEEDFEKEIQYKTTHMYSPRIWLCRCECGELVSVHHYNLTNFNQKTCGKCYWYDDNKAEDITGNEYGRLTVIRRDIEREEELRKEGIYKVFWICMCECGNFTSVLKSDLVGKSVSSCGCLHRDRTKESNKANGILKNGSFGEWCDNNLGEQFIKDYWNDDISPYKVPYASRDKVNLTCADCGTDYSLSAYNFTLARQRHSCGKSSKGEDICEEVLNELGFKFEKQKILKGCLYVKHLKFDFYIKDLNIIIEIDGEQHREPIEFFGGEKSFENTKIRDDIKNTYCKDNNIKMIRIPYYKKDMNDFKNLCYETLKKELKL